MNRRSDRGVRWACLFALTMMVSVVGCGSSSGEAAPDDGAFTGVCLGVQRQFYDDTQYGSACTAHFNSAVLCASVDGCQWTAGTFCSGYPEPCRTYDQSDCASAPGCKWYAPPQCTDEASCNEVMYVEEGGCADVPSSYLGTCSGNVYIDFGMLCGHASAPPIDCS